MIDNEKQEEIAKMILSYLRKHPDAGDTLEGLTRWWLEFEKVDHYVDDVLEALDLLVEGGLLKREKHSDVFLYKLNS